MANNCKQCFNAHYKPHCHPTTNSLWLCSSVHCGPPHQSRRIWLSAEADNQKWKQNVEIHHQLFWYLCIDFYLRPVLASGYCRACVIACVRLHDNSLSVQTRNTKFGSKVQNTLVRIPVVLGGNSPVSQLFFPPVVSSQIMYFSLWAEQPTTSCIAIFHKWCSYKVWR